MSESLHFPLAQGWSRGLTFAFEDRATSATLDLAAHFHCKQVHGRTIVPVDASDLARQSAPLAEADGMWAQGDWLKESKARFLVRTADCAPILMVDHKNAAVAAIHAGWRGVQQGIHRVPFEELGCFDPKTTWLWIGPCLSGDTFEVGSDMYDQFPATARRDPRYFAPHPRDPSKRFFHAWQYIADDYAKLGVELVYNVETDTMSTPAFASYRRSKAEGVAMGQQNFSWLGFT